MPGVAKVYAVIIDAGLLTFNLEKLLEIMDGEPP